MRTRKLLAVMSCLALLAACSRVASDWKSAQTADTAEAYQQFIREHGDSEFAARAELRVQQLSEESDWKQAAALDTRDAYEQFVVQHADGKWAQEARVRIENFKLAAAGGTAAPAAAGTAETPAPAGAAPVVAPKTAAAAPAKPAPAKPVAAAKPTPAPAKPEPAKPAVAKAAPKPAAPGSSVRVQLGAFSTDEAAQNDWRLVKGRWPQLVAGLVPQYEITNAMGKKLYRVRLSLPDKAAAEQFCATLKKNKHDCIITVPN